MSVQLDLLADIQCRSSEGTIQMECCISWIHYIHDSTISGSLCHDLRWFQTRSRPCARLHNTLRDIYWTLHWLLHLGHSGRFPVSPLLFQVIDSSCTYGLLKLCFWICTWHFYWICTSPANSWQRPYLLYYTPVFAVYNLWSFVNYINWYVTSHFRRWKTNTSQVSAMARSHSTLWTPR